MTHTPTHSLNAYVIFYNDSGDSQAKLCADQAECVAFVGGLDAYTTFTKALRIGQDNVCDDISEDVVTAYAERMLERGYIAEQICEGFPLHGKLIEGCAEVYAEEIADDARYGSLEQQARTHGGTM